MIIDFQTVSASEFAKMTKDPHVFYLVTSDASLEAGLYDENDNLVYSWDELFDQGILHFSGNPEGLHAGKPKELIGTLIMSNCVVSSYCFYLCNRLVNLYMPDGCNVPSYICSNCLSLRTVRLPNDVTILGEHCFASCALESIDIPASVTVIGYFAFYECTQLSTINYMGTISQWNQIQKRASWNHNVPATTVHCSDGDIAL